MRPARRRIAMMSTRTRWMLMSMMSVEEEDAAAVAGHQGGGGGAAQPPQQIGAADWPTLAVPTVLIGRPAPPNKTRLLIIDRR